MRTSPRGRSLFWTISGLFLFALVVGTLVQFVLAVAVLRPFQLRESRSRAELTASSLATEIAANSHGWSPAEYRSLIERHRAMLGPGHAVFGYRDWVGWRITDPPDRGNFLDRVQSMGLPPREGAPPPRDLIVRRPVMRGSERLGEVVVVRPLRPHGWPTSGGSAMVLLFVPIALVPVILGLLMVRILVRRLRAIELLAARVAEGDLSVRIGDASGDEIGRLAERLDFMTERLLDARTRVEATEQQRRQLFADITHELATPLTSIRGYAETLLDPAVSVSDEERARYLRGVLEESRRLDRLIRDLFELARLEAGASALTLERLDWAALCRNTVTRFEPRFHEAGLRLIWRGSAEQAWIEADGHRLEQVLENLLANALRYVPSDGTVELALTPAPGRAGNFRLTVSDDGPGLPPQDLAHAFERFYRAAGTRNAGAAWDAGGSGLGLAIVREIVERHGGTVRAETREPHGLAIIIELPART
jgi:two-component system, OmpR family, sensor histidine kinase BaeS